MALRGLAVAAALVGALAAGGCMTTRFLATDYDDRTESQWLTAFAVDVAVGAALIGTSFLVGDDGRPEPWTLSAGALSAGFGLLLLPLARYPDGPVMEPKLGATAP